jgi:hypothetical protein
MTDQTPRSGKFFGAVLCVLSGISAINVVGVVIGHAAGAVTLRDAALTASVATLAAFVPAAARDSARRKGESLTR